MIGRLALLVLAVAAVAGCASAQESDWSLGPRSRCMGERSEPATSTQVILFCAQSP
jgi:hypothetical protein